MDCLLVCNDCCCCRCCCFYCWRTIVSINEPWIEWPTSPTLPLFLCRLESFRYLLVCHVNIDFMNRPRLSPCSFPCGQPIMEGIDLGDKVCDLIVFIFDNLWVTESNVVCLFHRFGTGVLVFALDGFGVSIILSFRFICPCLCLRFLFLLLFDGMKPWIDWFETTLYCKEVPGWWWSWTGSDNRPLERCFVAFCSRLTNDICIGLCWSFWFQCRAKTDRGARWC